MEREFESNQNNSSEINNHNSVEETVIEHEKSEEHYHAVDETFTHESNEPDYHQTQRIEEVENIQSEDTSSEKMHDDVKEISHSGQFKSKKSKNFRGFATTLAAGVIGSVLTLTILPHTDYIKNMYPETGNQLQQQQSESSSAVQAVSAPSVVSNNSIADTVERVSKAIVGIVNYQQQQNNFYGNSNGSQSVQTGSGSGVIFLRNGNNAFIVTNNHVVEGATKLEISLYNGEKTTAEVVGTDALTDLAVLKIDSKYVTATAEFGDSSKLRPGDQVFAIGNPLGLDLSRTVTEGIVSAMNRSIAVSTSAGNWDTNVIQTDAAINPGNSGGALINSQGQVIGINSLKISETGVEGLGFAIPSNDFIPIVNELIKNGKIDRPYLGVGLQDLNQVPQYYWQSNLPGNVTEGVLLTQIDPNSAASRGGLQVKDVIVTMNGTNIASTSDLRKYLYTKVKKGDSIDFGVYRNGKLIHIKVQLTN